MRILIRLIRNYSVLSIRNKSQIRPLVNVSTSVNGVTNFFEETLTGRFLLYFNTDKRAKITDYDCIPPELANILNTNHFGTLQHHNVAHIFKLLSNPKYNGTKKRYQQLKILDSLFCEKLLTLDTEDIIKLLGTFVNIEPHRVTEYEFYHMAVDRLLSDVHLLSKRHLIQLMFYISFAKQAYNSRLKLRKCLTCLHADMIKTLTAEELGIICNATMKTSTKIGKKPLLDKIHTYIQDNLAILSDTAMFVTLIKTLRHNRYQTEDLLESISCAIFFNKTFDSYSFTAKCHILALFADFYYYDEKLLDFFTETCLNEVKTSSKFTSNGDYCRTKDIKRLLWALSTLNYQKLNLDDLRNVLIPRIVERCEMGEFRDDPGSLVEIILYLWMLNYRAKELVPYAFTKENLLIIRAEKSLSNKRLNLLLTCMYFEDPEYFKQLNVQPVNLSDYNTSSQLGKRPQLQRVLDSVKTLARKQNINRFELSTNVPHLNILGIVGFENKIYKSVYIEVLDEFTSLKNVREQTPNGLMQLKLRILDRTEEGVIVVNCDDIESMTESKLQELLSDEMNLVC